MATQVVSVPRAALRSSAAPVADWRGWASAGSSLGLNAAGLSPCDRRVRLFAIERDEPDVGFRPPLRRTRCRSGRRGRSLGLRELSRTARGGAGR
jgi:hypothetical protein